ncbi:MAG: hypothetical protein MUF49_08625 [Oculatellaceae cyanobacterium Prado106]|nr:hypothetical protein [Oculatellaceae cyanobacterium Prado106]
MALAREDGLEIRRSREGCAEARDARQGEFKLLRIDIANAPPDLGFVGIFGGGKTDVIWRGVLRSPPERFNRSLMITD